MRASSLPSIILFAVVGASCSASIFEPVGDPVQISWKDCTGSADRATWVAYQNGTTAWAAAASASGGFDFTLTADRGAVAYYVGPTLNIFFGTKAEIAALAPNCAGAVRAVTATVTGYAAADAVDVLMGSGASTLSGSTTQPASITLDGVEPDATEVVAIRSRQTATTSVFQSVPSSVLIRRSVSGNSLALLDLNSGTEAGAPLSRLASIAGATSGETIDVNSYLTTATLKVLVSTYNTTLGTVSGTTSGTFSALPAARLVTGELQAVRVRASKQVNSTTSEARYASASFTDAADQLLTLGPAMDATTITGTTRPAVSYAVQTGYDRLWEFGLDQSTKSIDIVMTAGYLGTVPKTLTIAVPDLTAVPGFDSNWLVVPGISTAWSLYASNAAPETFEGKVGTYVAGLRASTFVP